MNRNILFWIFALLITLYAAFVQEKTGPTHPVRGSFEIGNATYPYKLIRTHGGDTDATISVIIPDQGVTGSVWYKRYKFEEPWIKVPMKRRVDVLSASLPHQPPAGKLEYYIKLTRGDQTVIIPKNRDVVIRFRGAVPNWALFSHILLIFTAMLVSTRAGLETIPRNGKSRKYALWAAGLLFLGGMIAGPIVQKYAFGVFWSGAPFGWDLTDNKTLIAMIGWAIAVFAGRNGKPARIFVASAAILLLIIFSIPHSMMGSELDYSTGQVVSSGIEK